MTQALRDVFPGDTNPEPFALSADTRRAYYLTCAGEIWLHDRDRQANARVTTGNPWDLSLSPKGDALMNTKAGDGPSERQVWVTPLDTKTGLPAGADRRLSPSEGYVPSLPPDGRWVAFA